MLKFNYLINVEIQLSDHASNFNFQSVTGFVSLNFLVFRQIVVMMYENTNANKMIVMIFIGSEAALNKCNNSYAFV